MSNNPRDAAKLYIGTSGWSYKHWRDLFYPAKLSLKRWLEFYAENFTTVEINSSFYRLPKKETFESWREKTPHGFIFAVKASRYITHVKKLKGAENSLMNFLERANGLDDKLGPILFQFPANWHVNRERLMEFIKILPPGYRYAFEFRHRSWFHEDIYSLLEAREIALSITDSPEWPTPFEVTAPFVYIRLHGGRVLYASKYSETELSAWAKTITSFMERQRDAFVYFNNDAFGYAVENAKQLKQLLVTPK